MRSGSRVVGKVLGLEACEHLFQGVFGALGDAPLRAEAAFRITRMIFRPPLRKRLSRDHLRLLLWEFHEPSVVLNEDLILRS